MIRILHTIDTTGPGGAETIFISLIKGLDRQKFEPTVIIRGRGWVYNELLKIGIEPIFINSRGSFNLRYLFELVHVIRQKKIDLIQSHLFGSNVYSSLVGMICNIPVISTFHGFIDMRDKERFSLMKRWIVNLGSKKIVFVSDKLKHFYVTSKGFSKKKSVTIYNGVDTLNFKPQPDTSIREKLGLGPDNLLVGSVGNIRPAKGYDYLLEAARLVINQYPRVRFVVAGEGSGKLFDSLLDLRKKLELENHFFFIGFEPDVSKFINNLDIFVLPSVSEGFSISTIEAMACGVPVIATRSGGPEEIVRDTENGLLVKASSSIDLAGGMSKLFMDAGLKQKLISIGLETVTTKYSIKSMISSYCQIY
jgi:glycosyltransferase involved in cell wall biosynthesis